MANTRTPREIDTREFFERPPQWMPAELLPEPDKEAGLKYRGVRVAN